MHAVGKTGAAIVTAPTKVVDELVPSAVKDSKVGQLVGYFSGWNDDWNCLMNCDAVLRIPLSGNI